MSFFVGPFTSIFIAAVAVALAAEIAIIVKTRGQMHCASLMRLASCLEVQRQSEYRLCRAQIEFDFELKVLKHWNTFSNKDLAEEVWYTGKDLTN